MSSRCRSRREISRKSDDDALEKAALVRGVTAIDWLATRNMSLFEALSASAYDTYRPHASLPLFGHASALFSMALHAHRSPRLYL